MEAKDNNPKSTEHKGLKIQTLSRIFAVLGLLLLLFVGYNMHQVVDNYKHLVTEFNLHLDSHTYIEKLQNGSDIMTEQSRLFVVTRDIDCMQKYFEVVDHQVRESAMKSIEDFFQGIGDKQSLESLDKALRESNALMDLEIHAMKLMVQILNVDKSIVPKQVTDYQLPDTEESLSNAGKLNLATELVFNEKYQNDKQQIDSDIKAAVASISKKMENDTNDGIDQMWKVIYKMIISCILLAALFIIVFALIAVLVIRPLRIYVKCIKENRLFDIIGSYEFKYLALTYNNIFEINQENKARMSYELEHDTLTGAYSRLAFDEHKKLLSNVSIPIALLIIDVDKFKNVNDKYGHEAGDQTLVRIVQTLRHTLRNEDIISRIGGDEFAVILMNIHDYNIDVIGSKIDRINQILQNPADGESKLSISVGIAFSETGYSDELFKHADSALYHAKRAGRCGYSVYSE